MGEKTFADLVWMDDRLMDGKRAMMDFDNGYGVSVIQNMYSYGNRNGEGLYEAAVTSGGALWRMIDADDEVFGWLDEDGVTKLMDKVQALPSVAKAPMFKSIKK